MVTVVDVFFIFDILSLYSCVEPDVWVFLRLVIFYMIEIVLSVYRSLFSSEFDVGLKVSFANIWVVGISLATALAYALKYPVAKLLIIGVFLAFLFFFFFFFPSCISRSIIAVSELR